VTRVDPEALSRREFRPVSLPDPGRELPSNGVARHFDVVVVDPGTGTPLTAGQIGELWLRGDSVAAGYFNDAEATGLTFGARTSDGDGPFLRTGDLGTVHDGELYLTGRLKDTLIIHGRNIYPQDVEHELRLCHPELGSIGAVFPVTVHRPGGAAGEEVAVVLHEVQGRPEPDALAALCARMKATIGREFGIQAGAVVLLRRGGVRRTTSGKIERRAMRELFLAGELHAEHADLLPALHGVLPGTVA